MLNISRKNKTSPIIYNLYNETVTISKKNVPFRIIITNFVTLLQKYISFLPLFDSKKIIKLCGAVEKTKHRGQNVKAIRILGYGTEVIRTTDGPVNTIVRYSFNMKERPDKYNRIRLETKRGSRHPFCFTQLQRYESTDGTVHADVEYADGGPLINILNLIPENARVTAAFCIVRLVLVVLHHFSIVHKCSHHDIRPSTVFLQQDGTVKVDAFKIYTSELLKKIPHLFTDGNPYCPPEHRGCVETYVTKFLYRDPGSAGDVWSVGVLCLSILWGISMEPPVNKHIPGKYAKFCNERSRFEKFVVANNIDNCVIRNSTMPCSKFTPKEAEEYMRKEVPNEILRYLICRCLRVAPTERITLNNALAFIYIIGGIKNRKKITDMNKYFMEEIYKNTGCCNGNRVDVNQTTLRSFFPESVKDKCTRKPIYRDFDQVPVYEKCSFRFAQRGGEKNCLQSHNLSPKQATHYVSYSDGTSIAVYLPSAAFVDDDVNDDEFKKKFVELTYPYPVPERYNETDLWSCDENEMYNSTSPWSCAKDICIQLTFFGDYLISLGCENLFLFETTVTRMDIVTRLLCTELTIFKRLREETKETSVIERQMREDVKKRHRIACTALSKIITSICKTYTEKKNASGRIF